MNSSSSLNHVFRLVWSDRLGGYVAAPEHARGRGKGGRASAVVRALVGAAVLAHGGLALAGGLPTGGQVTAGQGTISQAGKTLTINQASQKLVTTWQSFDIAPGSTVNFVQPSATSVALNRVLGSDVSTIQGALNANGQVFLLNPNGVLFTSTAQVNVGGLAASTLALRDEDFLAGRYRFAGDSAASVTNQGHLNAPGGAVALVAARIVNSGEIAADRGQVLLGAGSDVTLDLGAPVKLQIHKGALDALIDNGGAIRADGGMVLLTARGSQQIASSAINNSGTVRARTLATGEQGDIVLLGDMATGTLSVGGTLDASAPGGGNGGHIETSAASVETRTGLVVDAGARRGQGGTWLIDPYDYTIDATAAGNIATALNGGTSVTVTTQSNNASYGSTASGSGDIAVASAISKTAGGDATLTLRADRNIAVNSAISSTSGKLGITLSAANNAASALGGVAVAANLTSNGGRILIGGAGGNATAAQSYGIGYALNTSASAPAVRVGTNTTISSGGGDITINGRTTASTASYDGSKAGVYVQSGATIDTGGGMLYVSGISAGDAKEFGFGVETSAANTITFKTSSTRGAIVVDARNTLNSLGALGLVNNGSQAKVQFWAPSVAHFQFSINGSNQAAQFTQSPPCNPGYPNCGTMVIPGGNQSYTSASYNVVSSAMLPIYIFTGNGTKQYDGTTDATGVALTSLGGPNGFTPGQLGALAFATPSKNVGSYDTLAGSASNPSSYQSGTYAVAYFNQGTYSVTAKPLTGFQAGNKVYDGTTAAAVTASGIVSGDSVGIVATGGFTQANVGNGIAVNVTGVSLSGADAGNYSIPSFSTINTSANITPAPLTVTAANAGKTYDGNAWSGGNGVTYTGLVNGETSAVLGGTLAYGGTSQGAVNAGGYTIVPSGLTASNYTIAFANGTLTITPAGLTAITGSLTGATSKVYDGTNTATLAPGNYQLVGFVGGDGATVTKTTGTYANANVGSGKTVTVSLTDSDFSATGSTNLANYALPTSASGTIGTITPASLTVTANNAAKTYDGLAHTGGNGVAYSGFVNGETSAVLGGALSYAGTAQGAINAGTYTITPQGLSSGNYTIGYASGNLTVNPATLTLAANAASRSYGAANPALSGSVTGFVNGESLATATTGSLAFSTSATGASNVGSYDITGSGLAATNGNYVFVQAAGNTNALTITPAALTVAANNASKTYDGLAFTGGNGVTYNGFVNGESSSVLGGSLSYAGTSQGAKNAGSYTITPQGLSAGNYTIGYTSGTLAIDPATLTLAANSASRTYGAANPALSGSVTGFVNGESLATATTGSLAFTTNATGASNVGSYAVNGGGLAANNGNYVFAQAAGNANALTVTPAALTVAAANASKTYDGLAYTGGNGVTYNGFVNGESSSVLGGSLSYAGTSQGAKNAGSYTITPQGLTAGNYTIGYTSGTLAIDPATLTLAANAASRTYGAANAALSGSVTGFVNGESLATATTGSLAFTTGATSTSNVGSYAVNGSGLAASNGNYVFVQAAGNTNALTITPAALTVAANNASKTYDGLAFAGGNGVTYTGFVNGESSSVLGGSLSYAGTSQGAKNAGSYTITPQGLTASNYTIGYTSGTLAIDPATLTLAANAASRTYGAANPALSGSVTGFVNGESLATATTGSLAFSTSATGASNVGSYAVNGSGLAASNGNYVFVQAAGNTNALTITPAALTVAANNASKTYDGLAFTGGNGVTYSGFVNGESSSVLGGSLSYAGTSQGAKNAGSYTITPQGLSAGNYTIGYTSGTLAIDPATLTLAANTASRTYGAANPALSGSVTGFVNGESLATATTGSLAFSTSATGASNVGSYDITGSGLAANNGNYVFVQAAGNTNALTITPAALTVAANNASKTYDGLAYTGGNGVAYNGFVNGESSSVLGGTLAYGGSSQGAVNAGAYTIAPQGLTAGNYAITFASGSLAVTPATLTIAANAASRTYGAANPALSGSVSGFVNGESLATATTGQLGFATPADASSPVGTYAVNGAGLVANHGNYVFVQAPANGRALSVTAAPVASDEFLPKTTPVPNFPDNAAPVLASPTAPVGFGDLNYVPVTTAAAVPAGAGAAAPAPTSTTTPTAAPASPTGTTARAAPSETAGGASGTALAPVGTPADAAVTAPSAAAETVPATAGAAAAAPVSTPIATPTTAPVAGPATTPIAVPLTEPASGSASASGTASPGASPDASSGVTGGSGSGSGSSNTPTAATPAPARTAKTGSAGIAVPSANGPLDVYVLEGGINPDGARRRKP